MERRVRRRQLRTLYCPSCGTRGSLRAIIYGLLFEEPDPTKYVMGGCTNFSSVLNIACIECQWEGIRETIDGSEITLELQFALREST